MPSPRQVQTFSRREFIDSGRWAYRPGEHVSVIGPTGWGKTHLLQDLLAASAVPKTLPGVALVMKPRDATVKEWAVDAGWRTVSDWPPPFRSPMQWGEPKDPPGWILWPKHSFDPKIDNPKHYEIFRRAILDSYKRGRRILFADEVYSLCAELGLRDEMITVWTKGRSMECGLWSATQKPTHVPLWMYSQAQHLFLGNDPDERARDRFKEIGGVDPKLIKAVVSELPGWHWLYILRNGPSVTRKGATPGPGGPRLCVVGP